jgi:hypothetical protein
MNDLRIPHDSAETQWGNSNPTLIIHKDSITTEHYLVMILEVTTFKIPLLVRLLAWTNGLNAENLHYMLTNKLNEICF